MSKQQIPPLRCGMTNKEQVQQQRPTAIATTTADSSVSLRNDKQRGKCNGKDRRQLQRQQQIPPLRCGMTNKKARAKARTTATHMRFLFHNYMSIDL
jgi:hypothetical protein